MTEMYIIYPRVYYNLKLDYFLADIYVTVIWMYAVGLVHQDAGLPLHTVPGIQNIHQL